MINKTNKKICLITPGHISCDPRLLKEATILTNVGYEVTVIAGNYSKYAQVLDNSVLSNINFKLVRVDMGTKLSYLIRKSLQIVSRLLVNLGFMNQSIAILAHSTMSYRLANAAILEASDLYIAHCLAALPAAAIAANKHKAKLGFDAEDFHVGELAEIPENQLEIDIRDYIERILLPRCDYLTAASPMIASAYTKRYGVAIEPILNVFPLSEAPIKIEKNIRKQRFSLYWFSQTIGADRGIESIIYAMGQMKTSVDLYLRGIPAAGYAEVLTQLANQVRVGDRIHLLPSAPPSEMARLASNYDIGLSIELNQPLNRSICLTNKIFTYLLAGLPVILSKTPAQQELSHQLAEAAIVIDIDDPSAIAEALDAWLCDSDKLNNARTTASRLGQDIYNWDLEQKKFLSLIEKVIS